MSWLEFFANIIDNVFSWPVAVLLIVLVLRKQLRELFRTVERLVLEAGGTKVSFTRNLEIAKEGITANKAILPHPDEPDEPDEAERQDIEYLDKQYSYASELAQKNPSYAMEVAWDRLMAEPVRRLADARGLPPGDTMDLLNKLYSRGLVGDVVVDVAKNTNPKALEDMKVETGGEHTRKSALDYVEIAHGFGEIVLDLIRHPDHVVNFGD